MSRTNGQSRQQTKVVVDRFWLSIGIPIIIWVFTAGMGWARLSNVESDYNKLHQRLEKLEQQASRLAVVETKVDLVQKTMDKLSTQLEQMSVHIKIQTK